MSVSYETYTNVYHGSIVAEEEWPHAELLASAHLSRIKALARVTPLVDDTEYADSMSICAMAEVVATWNRTTIGNGGLRSERVGSVTEQYASAAEVMPKGLGDALMASVRPWLHVNLVYGAF